MSVDYRRAPESPYPTAVDDAFAARAWIAARAQELGGEPGQLRVAGWSAGANLSAVVARRARDNDGPAIASQLLFNPATRADLDTGSYRDNGDGYILTRDMMAWFLDHYVTNAQRRLESDMPPARTPDLAGRPPAAPGGFYKTAAERFSFFLESGRPVWLHPDTARAVTDPTSRSGHPNDPATSEMGRV